MSPATVVRFEGSAWRLWLRYAGVRLMIWVGDYATRTDALQAAATIDGIE